MLPDIKANEIQQIMKSIDTDRSGKIDYTGIDNFFWIV